MAFFDFLKPKKKVTLPFKSNEDCYEYSKKFFSPAILKKNHLVLGIVYLVRPDTKIGLVKCTANIDNELKEVLILINVGHFKHPINEGDFVYVRIVEPGKLYFEFKVLENAINTQTKIVGMENLKYATVGRVVQKLTTELDLKSGQFVPF